MTGIAAAARQSAGTETPAYVTNQRLKSWVAEIAQLTEIFTADTVQQWGRVRQVVPKIVLEIACDQIQKSARHASGYALRFPRIKRIRWDKPIAEADRLPRVIEVYESAANFGRSDATAAAADAEKTPEPTLFDGLR